MAVAPVPFMGTVGAPHTPFPGFACGLQGGARFELVARDAHCPPEFVLDPCFALVTLAVLSHCRLRLRPTNASPACQGAAFNGGITGDNTAAGTLLLPRRGGGTVRLQPSRVAFDPGDALLRVSFHSCGLAFRAAADGAGPPPAGAGAEGGPRGGAPQVGLMCIAVGTPVLVAIAAAMLLAASAHEQGDAAEPGAARTGFKRREAVLLWQSRGSLGAGAAQGAAGAAAPALLQPLLQLLPQDLPQDSCGQGDTTRAGAADWEAAAGGLEARRQRRRHCRKRQQLWMSEALDRAAVRGALDALLPFGARLAAGRDADADGFGSSGSDDDSGSSSDSGSSGRASPTGPCPGPAAASDSGAVAIAAARRTRQLRKKLRRPLFVGHESEAGELRAYQRGAVDADGSRVARLFRFAPVACPPQLAPIDESDWDSDGDAEAGRLRAAGAADAKPASGTAAQRGARKRRWLWGRHPRG
ncbi:hypothetical protein Rsub_08429 [Raphidocelis subcapitata]|uniref:Uncharacterized protein n=1 Tax=Raphidocelis subcapitata TaxID=307507 RepID=A0A2V0P8E9_9CHLO|nr:hypothetical protein Rsub_08429 [Raphidocelis subcapitata]|eukprot:GBF95839.1 hypothetical protein Rsub_08429 [Raphidocelis subcapitata]